MTDIELVKKAKAGDLTAFEALVKRYEPRVAATVIGMLGHCQVADDVGQEVFVRLYKYLKSFREDASLATYLTRIAINLSLNELKRRKRRQLLFGDSEGDLTGTDGALEESIEQRENQRLVQQAIQRLEPAFRSVVVLRLIEGYSTEETARLLNIPLGTVLSRLSRAQKKLRTLLTPFMQEEI